MSRTCSWENMPPCVHRMFVFHLEVTIFSFSVQWLTLQNIQHLSYIFRKAPGLPSQISISHSTMSSYVIHRFSSYLNITKVGNFSFGRYFPIKITLVVSFLRLVRTESIVVILSFLCFVALTSTNFAAFVAYSETWGFICVTHLSLEIEIFFGTDEPLSDAGV